jgi:hypothetical protein
VRAAGMNTTWRGGRGLLVRRACCVASVLVALAPQSWAQAPSRMPSSYDPPSQTLDGAPSASTAYPASNPFASSGTRDDRILLPLLLQERMLLQEYGHDHPEVRTIQSRIETAREFLRQHPEPQPAERPQPPVAVVPPRPQTPASIAPATFTPPAGTETLWPSRLPAVAVVPRTPDGSDSLNLSIVPTAPAPIQASRPKPANPVSVPPTPTINRPGEQIPVATSVAADTRPPSRSSPVEPSPEKRGSLSLGPWELVGILAAFLVGLLVHIVALFFIIRRNGEREAVYRVELVNAPPLMAVPSSGQLASAAEERGLRMYPGTAEGTEARKLSSEEEEKPDPEFDLGLTYEEEQRLNEEIRRQEEEAMLRQLLEKNLQLRTDIAELSSTE